MTDSSIYLDCNATTPVDERVLEVMLPFFKEVFGNAASLDHAMGHTASQAVERARSQVAGVIGADPREIIWTSGATESNNLTIKGVAEQYGRVQDSTSGQSNGRGQHIVSVLTEHKAVIDPLRKLERAGYEITWLKPDANGLISPGQIEESIREDTILVSVMWANNEIGVIQPIADIGKVCKAAKVLFHTDATQALGKVKVDVMAAGVDLLSASAHKCHGPKGAGFLYVRRKGPRVRLAAQIDGGGHERGFRSGSINVPGVVGMGEAVDLCGQELALLDGKSDGLTGGPLAKMAALRNRLEQGIIRQLPGVTVNGHRDHRLPNTSSMSFAGVEAQSVIMALPDIAVSAGAACSSASTEPSYVLRALGVSDDLAHSTIRFSLGRMTTADEIERTIKSVVRAVRRLREISPLDAGLAGAPIQKIGQETGQKIEQLHRALGGQGTRCELQAEPRLAFVSETLLDHFDQPRNIGPFEQGDRAGVWTGRAGSTECGDLLELHLKLGPDTASEDQADHQAILAARFRAYGHSATIAAGSFATEWLPGKLLADAVRDCDQAIAAALDLPPSRAHCSVLVESALRDVARQIAAFVKQKTEPLPQPK